MERRLVGRIRGHGKGLLQVIQRQACEPSAGRPVGGPAEGDPGLGGKGIGLRPGGCREVGVAVVCGQDPGQLVAVEGLEVARGREVARPTVLLRQRLVGDLADQPLDEDVLAALRRARIVIDGQDLASDEAPKSRLERLHRVPGERPRVPWT